MELSSWIEVLPLWQIKTLGVLSIILMITKIACMISGEASRHRRKNNKAHTPNNNSTVMYVSPSQESKWTLILGEISRFIAVVALIMLVVWPAQSLSPQFVGMLVLFAVLSLKR